MHVTDRLKGLFYSLSTEMRKIVEKQRKDIKTTLKIALDAIAAFLQSIDKRLVCLNRFLHIFC